MLNNYQIITVTPSGRRRYLEILVKYLLQLRHIIDKHVFWINTNKEEDLDYIYKIVDEYPHFFEILEVKDDEIYGNDLNVGKFYKYCKDTESIYIKIDDDIVFMQLSKFENFLNFRINNPEFFLVSANVINNGISHFIYNKLGLYGLENTLQVNYEFNNDAWLYPEAAIYSFNKFKDALYENNLEKFNFDRWILSDNEIFSINLISWFGKDFAEMDIWGHYDEPFLSWVYPARIQRKNCIYGGFLAVHYSYFTQRKVIDSKPEILDFFKQLSNNVQLKNPA